METLPIRTVLLLGLLLAGLQAPGAALAAGVSSESEWNALYKEVREDLLKGTTGRREKAVRRIAEADWPGAVNVLVDFLAKPVARLIPLERRRIQVLQDIERLMRLHDNQKGLAPDDSARMRKLQEDLKSLNETLFRENAVKRLAARLLGGLENAKAVDLVLEEALEHRSWRVRLALLESLARLKDPRADGILDQALAEEDPAIRSTALESLARRGVPDLWPRVREALHDGFWQVRVVAVAVAGRLGEIEAVDVLIEALKGEDGRLRGDIGSALESLTGKRLDPDAELWASWWGNPEHRAQAEDLCAQWKRLRSADGALRAEAVRALAKRGPRIGFPVAREAFQEGDAAMREAGIEAFEILRDLAAVPLLLAALEAAEGPARGRIEQALIVLTGCKESFDADPDYWNAWWRRNEAKVREEAPAPPEPADPGEARQAAKTGTSFYGIPTHSKNVVFILDVSGSMNAAVNLPEGVALAPKNDPAQPGPGPRAATRLGLAQWELKKAVAGLAEGSQFNILHYSTGVTVFSPRAMVPASAAGKAKAYGHVDTLEAFGGTNIHDALVKAFTLADPKDEKKNLSSGVDTIYFLSDGMPTLGEVLDPERILEAVRERNRHRRVVIHCICLVSKKGDDIPQEDPMKMEGFMRRLADENGGRFVKR